MGFFKNITRSVERAVKKNSKKITKGFESGLKQQLDSRLKAAPGVASSMFSGGFSIPGTGGKSSTDWFNKWNEFKDSDFTSAFTEGFSSAPTVELDQPGPTAPIARTSAKSGKSIIPRNFSPFMGNSYSTAGANQNKKLMMMGGAAAGLIVLVMLVSRGKK